MIEDAQKEDAQKEAAPVHAQRRRMDDLAASAGAELYDYLYDYDWNVRMEALEMLGKLGPAARAQHAGAVIDTWLEGYDSKSSIECRDDDEDRYYVHTLASNIVLTLPNVELAKYADAVVARLPELSRDMRIETAKMLGKLEPASVARWYDDLAAMLEGSEKMSCEALETLCQMEPAALAQYANAIVARLSDSSKDVRNWALETLAKLEPATIAQHAEAVVAMLEDSEMYVRIAALYALRRLEPATLAQCADAIVARLSDSSERVRTAALETLAKLEPATIAQHAGAVIVRLNDPVGAVRWNALMTLHNLEPVALALYAEAVVARLDDSDWKVRQGALKTLGKLEPAALAQHAGAVVTKLEDSDRSNVRKEALETLAKLEPARFAPHTGAVIDAWLEFHPDNEYSARAYGPFCPSALARIRALPCYRAIDFVSVDMYSAAARSRLRSRLLARLRWYMYGLRLRVQRIALYWYALPYRPSGPGHSRDVVAWESMMAE